MKNEFAESFRTFSYRAVSNQPTSSFNLCRTQFLSKSQDIYGAYPPNTYKFGLQKYSADSGRSARFLDFSFFFFFFPKKKWYSLFFEKNFFWPKF